MAEGFFKAMRSEESDALDSDMCASHLLLIIAKRARRKDGFSIYGLQPGEALIGDLNGIGMTRGQYRAAIERLSKWKFATFRTTTKGTIAKLTDTRVYDINIDDDNHQTTIKQPSNNHQTTTNKNERKKEEGKEPPISPVPGDCDGEPAKADDPPKPEAVPAIPAGMLYHTPGEQERREQAKAIIADLNTRCGKSFPDTGGILSVILERLREGRHPPEFEKIITNKLADPHFQANPSLYTPNTLFRATHFDQYLSEKPSEYNTGGKNGGRDYQSGRKRHIAERPIEEQAKPHGEEAFWVGTDPGESSGARP